MLLDFLIGLFAANALPHFVMGRLDARVLGLFGYGALGNVMYALFCTIVSLSLFHFKYGLTTILEHGMLVGVLFVVASYYLGWPIIVRCLTDRSQR